MAAWDPPAHPPWPHEPPWAWQEAPWQEAPWPRRHASPWARRHEPPWPRRQVAPWVAPWQEQPPWQWRKEPGRVVCTHTFSRGRLGLHLENAYVYLDEYSITSRTIYPPQVHATRHLQLHATRHPQLHATRHPQSKQPNRTRHIIITAADTCLTSLPISGRPHGMAFLETEMNCLSSCT